MKDTNDLDTAKLSVILAAFLLIPSMGVILAQVPGTVPEPDTLDLSGIYWPMIGRGATHYSSGSSAPRGMMDPTVAWSGNTSSLGAVGADMTSNVIFDGVNSTEVFGIVESNGTYIRIRNGDSGEYMWEMDVRMIEGRDTNRLRMAPALADTDSDGKVEIVVYIWDVNQFQLGLFEPVITLNSTGFQWSVNNYYDERKWLSILVPTVPDPASSPILHDISGDGVEDVIVGSSNDLVSFYGNNGTLMWLIGIGPMGETLSTPAVYPGPPGRIVVNSLSATQQIMRTTIVNFEGFHLKNVTVGLGLTVPYRYLGRITMPVVGDVTGDGQQEIMISYPSRFGEGRVIIYSYQLDELATIDTIQGILESTPSLADVDGDGDMEIFLDSRFYTTNSWINMSCYDVVPQGSDLTVNVRWWRDGTNIGTTPLYTSPLICDLDEDDAPDAIFFAHNWVHAISFSGRTLWNLHLSHQQFGFQGLVGDLGGDAFTDVFFDGIYLSQKVVDLTVKDPPSVNIYTASEPVDGLTVGLSCLIENLGTSSASDVDVLFEDTPPGGVKELIGYAHLDEVATTTEASVEWTPRGVGQHRIDVTVDPNSTIVETDENNNEGYTGIDVRVAIPDLIVHDIKFLRGDGLRIEGGNDGRRLVEEDPSTIVVQIGNIGEGPSSVGLVNVMVNGSSPGPEASNVPIGPVEVGSVVNISVPWTPDEIPGGAEEVSVNVSASIDTDTQGMAELDKFNNDGFNHTMVKSKEPVGGFEIIGRAYNTQGRGEFDVKVTATNDRTQSSLEDRTDVLGDYSIYFPATDYLDADEVSIYGKKSTSWAENTTRMYSEDGRHSVDLHLTDIPTLSMTMTPDGQMDYEVLPRVEYNLRFWVENTGNIPGNVTIDRAVEGNTSLGTEQVIISPNRFELGPGERTEVAIRFTVPPDEEPGRVAVLTVEGILAGNGSDNGSLVYTFTVGRSGSVYYEFDSPRNVTLNANRENRTSFLVYLLDQGNIPVDYNLSVTGELVSHSVIYRGKGTLSPSDSTQIEVIVTLADGRRSLTGSLELRTSGSPDIVTWDVRIDMEYPNLVAGDIIVGDPNFELGDTISLFGNVRNDGDVEADSVKCSFYQGTDLIGSSTILQIKPGEEVTLESVQWEPTGTGDKEVSFVIDPDNGLLESSKDDNQARKSFSFHADLSISSVDLNPRTVRGGGEIRAIVVLKNVGNARVDRGFNLTIRDGGASGSILEQQDYDEDIPTGGEQTVRVELIFRAPDRVGKINIWVGVSLLTGTEKVKGNNDDTVEINVEAPPAERTDLTLYIVAGVIVSLVILGGALYVWKFGLPIAPPPEAEEGSPESEETEDEEPMPPPPDDLEEEPIVEMSLEPSQEPTMDVVIAEVVEERIPGETGLQEPVPLETVPPGEIPGEDEEGMIPEV